MLKKTPGWLLEDDTQLMGLFGPGSLDGGLWGPEWDADSVLAVVVSGVGMDW